MCVPHRVNKCDVRTLALEHNAEVRTNVCRTDLSDRLTRRRVVCYRLVIVANRAVVLLC